MRRAKTLFKELTVLQNRLEDAFNDSAVYNRMGAILRMADRSRIRAFLQWYSDSVVALGKDTVKEQLARYLDGQTRKGCMRTCDVEQLEPFLYAVLLPVFYGFSVIS